MIEKTDNYKEAFENLANAIILQAVKDYRRALSGCQVDERDSKSVIEQCETFFRSEWFRGLTDVDGEYLIKTIRKEFEI